MKAFASLQPYVTTRTFRAGLGLGLLAYAGMFGALWYMGSPEQHGSAAATRTVQVTWETPPPVAPTPEHTEAPHGSETPASSATLPEAPVEGLSEETPDGRLPMVRQDDHMTSFDAYRRPAVTVEGPKVAIGLIGYGLSDEASKGALSDLAPEVSVVMSPYTNSADYWINEARAHGHEVWLELPVETEDYPRSDPGPQTLLVGGIEKQNIKKLYWVMSQAFGYAGVVTGYQPTLMKSEIDARPVLKEVYGRGLGFIDGDSNPLPLAGSMAHEMKAPYGHADVWIDRPGTAEHMAASLRQLEVLAQGQGSATGIISSTPENLKMLQGWIDGLKQKGITLVPLSMQAQKTSE